ncbi:hypothetical protein ABT052_40830 [Streptomyces sp. NPDC002766]|uniref:phenylacetate--CoA ligase family protein n=1 Tax=Streptomyces sp. NPDC002766 TaxID=3154429 RepID=UPI0033192847
MLDPDRPRGIASALAEFAEDTSLVSAPDILGLFRRVAATVPAYGAFLAERGVDPDAVRTLDAFRALPLTDKESYHHRYPLAERCRDGRPADLDIVAVSSGSSGRPTLWPRSVLDELHIARRFEQIFADAFRAAERSTLAVVCFPLGTWVGGLFTAGCVRLLSAKGYPVTVVAPGNKPEEILRVLPELAPGFDQTVLLGYPPFLKDVIDTGAASGLDWSRYAVKLVFAGEVFSEEWRDIVGARAGLSDPVRDTASLYGTADAGVLGNETPLSITVRRFFAARPDAAREVFGDARLPTLVQYDPGSRYFEQHEGTLVFTGDSGVPLIRYHIADEGGVIPHAEMLRICADHGFDPVAAAGTDSRGLPFVYVFGRSLFTVSYFGANIYPENVSVGLEQPGVHDWVSGRFVLEVVEDESHDRQVRITVERAPGKDGDPALVARSVRDQLRRLNSEFANYVPEARQLPEVRLRDFGDPEYFPPGVKHRYTRG